MNVTAQRLTVFSDPLHTVVYLLDGVFYTFFFQYSGREDRWYVDVLTESGEALAHGLKLVQGVSLLELVTDDRAPRGVLCVYPLIAGAGDPGLNDFVGDNAPCGLFYIAASELG